MRLEGTNVDLGKKILRDSGLNVIPADDLDDAAHKIVSAVRAQPGASAMQEGDRPMPPSKINVLEAVDRKVKEVFRPFIVGDINDSQVKVAKFGAEFDWHAHEREDEAFFVLRGRIAIDFRDGVSELGEGDFVVVPRGVEHRPRSLSPEPVVLMFEPSTTLNTGDAASALTVRELDRL